MFSAFLSSDIGIILILAYKEILSIVPALQLHAQEQITLWISLFACFFPNYIENNMPQCVVGRINGLKKHVHILIQRTCTYLPYMAQRTL